MRKKQKGCGSRSYRALNLGKGYALFKWMENNEDKCARNSSDQLSVMASEDLGFEIGISSALNYRRVVYPDLRRHEPSSLRSELNELKALLALLIASATKEQKHTT